MQERWDYIYEPDSRRSVDALMVRYIESLVYQGVVEDLACERRADGRDEGRIGQRRQPIGELQLTYNKARQATITQELSESSAAPQPFRSNYTAFRGNPPK